MHFTRFEVLILAHFLLSVDTICDSDKKFVMTGNVLFEEDINVKEAKSHQIHFRRTQNPLRGGEIRKNNKLPREGHFIF